MIINPGMSEEKKGGVSSFNGRTGAIAPQSGDYTADMVGALASGGTATAATKLATARTIRTNLASTSTASFNGTANVAPGVTGVLPVANGGTGSSTEKYLPLAGGTVSGLTTFSGNPVNGAVTGTDGVVINGNLRMKGTGANGNTIRFGDGDYVHLSEPTDDCLEIKAKTVNFVTTQSPGVTVNGTALGGGGGLTLVASGTLQEGSPAAVSVDSNGLYFVCMAFSDGTISGTAFVPFRDLPQSAYIDCYMDWYFNESRNQVRADINLWCEKTNSTTMSLSANGRNTDISRNNVWYYVYKIG